MIHPELGERTYPATVELCRHAAQFMYGYALMKLGEGVYSGSILECVAALGPAMEGP